MPVATSIETGRNKTNCLDNKDVQSFEVVICFNNASGKIVALKCKAQIHTFLFSQSFIILT